MKNTLSTAFLLSFFLFLNFPSYSFGQQEVVKLTTNGYGQNENEAVTDALKMAVENSFGVYISTETQIINDELIKDEITSLGKGSILSYNITDQKKLGESNYIVTVDSEVSIVNLKTFAASKGVEVDFEGALFASNLKLQELNEQNEIKLVQSFIKELSREFRKSVEFTIKYDEPLFENETHYSIATQVDVEVNENSKNIEEMLDYFSKSITMDIGEVENYIKLGKPVYPVYLSQTKKRKDPEKDTYFIFRGQTKGKNQPSFLSESEEIGAAGRGALPQALGTPPSAPSTSSTLCVSRACATTCSAAVASPPTEQATAAAACLSLIHI